MPVSFSSSELINLAIDIEKRGIAFYDIMSRSTENTEAREIFQELMVLEREHVRVFQDMLGEDKNEKIPGDVSEYSAYLETLMDNAAFNEEAATDEMAARASDDITALALGITLEKDSLLFYYELKDRFSRPSGVTLDRIIEEEKKHLRQLTKLKKRLDQ